MTSICLLEEGAVFGRLIGLLGRLVVRFVRELNCYHAFIGRCKVHVGALYRRLTKFGRVVSATVRRDDARELYRVEIDARLVPLFLVLREILYHRRGGKGVTNARIFFRFPTRRGTIRRQRRSVASCGVEGTTRYLFRALFAVNNDPRFGVIQREFCGVVASIPVVFRCRRGALAAVREFCVFFFFILFVKDFLHQIDVRRVKVHIVHRRASVGDASRVREAFGPSLPLVRGCRILCRDRAGAYS